MNDDPILHSMHHWHAQVLWDPDTCLPMAMACCEETFPLTDPAAHDLLEAGFDAAVDHVVEKHDVPPELITRFIASLPMIGMQMHIERLLGDDEDDD